MRILHVTREIGSDRRYGIGRSLAPVVQALQARGHEVRYLTQDDQSPRGRAWQQRWTERLGRWGERLAGAPGRVLAAVWIERLNMGRLAAKVARDMRADIVHLHDPWMAWGFRLARLVYRGPPLRWGVTEHGFGAYADATGEEGVPYSPALLRWHRCLEAKVLAAARWVICPSHSARAQLARDLALPDVPGHWRTVPHPRPVLHAMDRAQARALLGWDSDAVHVLAIGRLNPVKRFDALLRACMALGRPLTLNVLGEGDAAGLEHVLALTPGTAVTLQVAAVDDVAPYLAAADVYVCTSRNESFGMANLEALRMGVPSVCTAAGSIAEVTGGAALLVPAGDVGLVDNTAKAIVALLDDPMLRSRVARAGERHARSWPDAKAVAQQLVAIYDGDPGSLVTETTDVGDSPSAKGTLAAPTEAVATSAPVVDALCALPRPLPLEQARRVLVLAPHPDDESIGCGGMLALLTRAGVAVRVVLVTNGAGAGGLPAGSDVVRHREFVAALGHLGVTDHVWLRFEDGALKLDDSLRGAIVDQVREFEPNWILAPDAEDLHRDHRVVAWAAIAAANDIPSVEAVWHYETWHAIQPSHVLDISSVLVDKLAAVREHRTALTCGNYLEGAEGLARYRALLMGQARPGAAAETFLYCERPARPRSTSIEGGHTSERQDSP